MNEWMLWAAVLGVLLLALEIGVRAGWRRHGHDDGEHGHVGALQGALLGLLALLLGFTFAMSVARFDTRKALVLEEANAIGTTALRARLLPAPQAGEAVPLLRSYVAARRAFYAAGIDTAALAAAEADATRAQDALWTLAVTAAAQDRHAQPTALFIQSLNDVIDMREKRQVAFDNHVPEVVLALLIAVAAAALGLVGYGSGLTGQRRWVPNALFALLASLVFITIVDLDRPRRGLIQVSQGSMLRVEAALAPLETGSAEGAAEAGDMDSIRR